MRILANYFTDIVVGKTVYLVEDRIFMAYGRWSWFRVRKDTKCKSDTKDLSKSESR